MVSLVILVASLIWQFVALFDFSKQGIAIIITGYVICAVIKIATVDYRCNVTDATFSVVENCNEIGAEVMFDLSIVDIMKTNTWQDHAGGPIARDYQCMFPAFHRANSPLETDQVLDIAKAMLSRTFWIKSTATTLEQYNNINLSATGSWRHLRYNRFCRRHLFRTNPTR